VLIEALQKLAEASFAEQIGREHTLAPRQSRPLRQATQFLSQR
jgi:hypothetical protein